MKVLAIETSCDETAICLLEGHGDFGADFRFSVLGNALASQADLHAQYGGVYPNMAKREHQKNLVPVLQQALQSKEGEIRLNTEELKKILAREPELFEILLPFLGHHARPDIDCIAVTAGPGLEPALWVGVNFAKALSMVWNVPLIAVNHMEGHFLISTMSAEGKLAPFEFPVLGLLISGGHTELVLSREFMRYERIGQTRDDAVGEAFDKVARLLGLPYPGGPHISRLAEEARSKNTPRAFKLPRPMLSENNYDFSFSGLKTAVRKLVEARPSMSDEERSSFAREFEDAAADVLVEKTARAATEYGVHSVLVGGGVSANTHIRRTLAKKLEGLGIPLLTPPPALATDNALMIALAGYFHALKGEFIEPEELNAKGNLKLAYSKK